jgi:uncharacterized membrane protein
MFELLKMAHLIMIAMGSGLVLSHYVMLRASAGLEAERGLALARRTLADITSFVVASIWISGLTLLWSRYGDGDGERELSSWFYAKLVFVVLFTAAHLGQRISAARPHRTGDLVALRRILEQWVSAAWLAALLAICLAVVSFR